MEQDLYLRSCWFQRVALGSPAGNLFLEGLEGFFPSGELNGVLKVFKVSSNDQSLSHALARCPVLNHVRGRSSTRLWLRSTKYGIPLLRPPSALHRGTWFLDA